MPLFRSLANTWLCFCVYSVAPHSLQGHELQPARLTCPWNFLGENTGVGCHFLLQRIFPSQRLNLHLLASPVLVDGFFTTSVTWEAPSNLLLLISLYEEDIQKEIMWRHGEKIAIHKSRGEIESEKPILLTPRSQTFSKIMRIYIMLFNPFILWYCFMVALTNKITIQLKMCKELQ